MYANLTLTTKLIWLGENTKKGAELVIPKTNMSLLILILILFHLDIFIARRDTLAGELLISIPTL